MISIELIGRTGNQLFQYAACRSVAERNGYNYHIDSGRWVGKELFDIDFGHRDNIGIRWDYIEQWCQYNSDMWNIKDGTMLHGYFQSEKCFDNDKARQWFKLKPDSHTDELIAQYPIDQYCYINLRGTDVKELGCQKLSLDYYNLARNVVKSIVSDIKFIVITDDIPFGHEYFPEYSVMTNSVKTDFTLLNRAKYVILADSSFAWWAAWLNENNFVVAPHGWLNVNVNKWLFSPKDIKVNRFIWV
jgi:hypothetical protein